MMFRSAPGAVARFALRHWKPCVALAVVAGTAEVYGFGARWAADWRAFWAAPVPPSQRLPVEPGTHQPILSHRALPIRVPSTVRADAARIGGKDLVIGVSAGGKHRAYRLDAFRKSEDHVVNDMVGGQPITVTYCNFAECIRVFSDSQREEPLDIRQVGLRAGRFVIEAGSVSYYQDNGDPVEPSAGAPFPFADYPSQTMTWDAWRTLHPDTDLYEVAVPEPARARL